LESSTDWLFFNILMDARSAFLVETDSRGPASSARVGQTRTQAGFKPFLKRTRQRSHFTIFPFRENRTAPKEQTIWQARHPMQSERLISTIPQSSVFEIALFGHALAQGGSAQ
jgi:hypothetical protein